MKILNVYKWATVGGVERVILNRASAFKKHGVAVRQDVFFFHDSGGLSNFKKFIAFAGLDEYINIVSKVDERNYDYIISFDTPEIFDMIKNHSKVVIECHSPYKESRVYLKLLPSNIACIASPGETFQKTVVRNEIREDLTDKLRVLPNFHIMDIDILHPQSSAPGGDEAKIWGKKPICYIGRMDSMKNTKELFEIFIKLRAQSDDYFLLLCGDVRPHYMDLKETLRKAEVEDRVAYLRPIPYEKVDALLRKVLAHEGIFVSPSLGESFGLSALEAMTNKVPVLLSDIECHKTLVQENSDFLYSSGDTKQAAEKIMGISRSYDVLSAQTAKLASVYSSSDFINAWERMIESFD